MKELQTFIEHKNFGTIRSKKPQFGKLTQNVNGKTVTLEKDKPFPLLQTLKKSYQQKGFTHLKVTY
jgi:ubiquinone/menaquinone biosynthesis C-methylase UbiE